MPTDDMRTRAIFAELLEYIDMDPFVNAVIKMSDESASSACIMMHGLRGELLVRELCSVGADRARHVASRRKALWLLKEVCDPLSWSTLAEILTNPAESRDVIGSALDGVERLTFAKALDRKELEQLSEHMQKIKEPEIQEKWLRVLGTLGGAWAYKKISEYLNADRTKEAALQELINAGAPEIDDLIRSEASKLTESKGADRVVTALESRRAIEIYHRATVENEPITSDSLSLMINAKKFAMIYNLLAAGLIPRVYYSDLSRLETEKSLSRSQKRFLNKIKKAIGHVD